MNDISAAIKIYSELQTIEKSVKHINIFLCGGSENKQKIMRNNLRYKIESKTKIFSYSVYYPEHLFFEVLQGHQKYDLLSLENMLAESVDAVAILPNSAGTLAELGAFANSPSIQDRLVVISENYYLKQKSFIRMGPISHLMRNTKSGIVGYDDFKLELDDIAEKVAKFSRQFKKSVTRQPTLVNPIFAYKAIAAIIHILSPIAEDRLYDILDVQSAGEKYKYARPSIDTAIGHLLGSGYIHKTRNGFTSHQSAYDLVKRNLNKTEQDDIDALFNEIRLSNLTYKLRNKKKEWRRWS